MEEKARTRERNGARSTAFRIAQRAAVYAAPTTGIAATAADLAQPIASFGLYLFSVAVVVSVVSGVAWYGWIRKRPPAVEPAEGEEAPENPWLLTFSFAVVASVVLGGVVAAQAMMSEADRGALASTIPGLDRVQDSLLRIERDVAEIKDTTADIQRTTGSIKDDTRQIRETIEDVAASFEGIERRGGIIAEPASPAEHYHNARLHELNGDFAQARSSYNAYLAAKLDLIDPWLSYGALLKAQEGLEGARETMRFVGQGNETPSFGVANALLLDREKRIAKLEQIAAAFPDYGPAPWLLANEYSEAKLGEQTLADQNEEKRWLERFRELHAAGRFRRFVLDQKEADRWLADAETRLARLDSVSSAMRETPVQVDLMQSSSGWTVTFLLTDFKAKEILYRIDGQGEFRSTGHQLTRNRHTGFPVPVMQVELRDLAAGDHTIEVEYVDAKDQRNGPFAIQLNTTAESLADDKFILEQTRSRWVSFRHHSNQLLTYFTHLLAYRESIREIRYSIDGESLEQSLSLEPDPDGEEGILRLPAAARFVAVKVIFRDGSESAVERFATSNADWSSPSVWDIEVSERSGGAPLGVRFSPDVRDGKPPLKFAWRFGDGSPESSEESPEHRFPRPGYYEVTLQVVDALGRGDEDTVGVSVPD